ncbi:hypothetical protein GCM10009627_13350 [Curtobacterium herbarum]|uniref:Uncharacterized protein n=1 Tax=Curtobacterium herbarum TaxID=150122 RepID=A0ABP4K6K7_9MICO
MVVDDALPDGGLAGVDAGGADLHEHAAGLDLGNGDVGDVQDGTVAPLLEADGAHGVRESSHPASRYARRVTVVALHAARGEMDRSIVALVGH